MAKEKSEYVMVFPADLLRELGYFDGLETDYHTYVRTIMKNATFHPREAAETDERLKQVIPYVIIEHEGKILKYRRGKGVGEQRLVGAHSISFGGHVSLKDPNLFGSAYEAAVAREVSEELFISSPVTDRIVAILNDDSDHVGRVHFGIVHIWQLRSPEVRAREKALAAVGSWC